MTPTRNGRSNVRAAVLKSDVKARLIATAISLMFLCTLLVAVASPVKAAPPRDRMATPVSDIATDPALVRGQLPNGLRYAILPNATPAQSLLIRLYIDAGSFEESEQELGAAHFLEHMAFNGSRQFAEDTLVKRFEAAGVAFGRDQNASTTADGTTYELDLNEVDKAKLDLGFAWLRDVADGLSLEPPAVDRERGVVMAEYSRSLGPLKDLSEDVTRFMTPDLRGPKRSPIGTASSIKSLDAATLRGFYRRWYIPGNAYLVVVGDAPVAEIKARIEASFSTWTAAPLPARANLGRVDPARGTEAFTRSAASLPTMVNICRINSPTPDYADTLANRTRYQPQNTWDAVLNDRLDRLARTADAPFVAAEASIGGGAESDTSCLRATAVNDDWQRALRALNTEMRRLDRHGILPEEWTRLKTQNDTGYQRAIAQAQTRTNSQLASRLLFSIAKARVFTTPEETKRVHDLSTRDLTPEQIAEAFRQSWAGGGPLITVISPKPVDTATIKATWTQAMAEADPAAPIRLAAVSWPYATFGTPGIVVKREEIKRPGFVRLTFANGMRVNFKSVRYTRDAISIRVRFGSGQRQISAAQRPVSLMAEGLAVEGGLGKLTLDQLRDANLGRAWGVNLSIDRSAFVLSGGARAADFEREMEILTAFISDAGFRPDADAKLATGVDGLYRMVTIMPSAAATLALGAYVAPDGSQSLPPKAELLKVRTADVKALLQGPLSTEGLEVTIVGDLTEAQAIAATTRTLGTLTTRNQTQTVRPDFMPVRFPKISDTVLRADHEGSPKQALVMVVWPTFVSTEARRREMRALNLASDIFEERLRDRLREGLGKSYAPSVTSQFPNRFDQGSVKAVMETTPADASAMAQEAFAAARLIAQGQFTAADLERVRKPLLDGAAKRRESHGFWLNLLDGSWRDPSALVAERSWERDYRTLSLSEVRIAAARWLGPDQALVVVSAPKAVKTEVAVTATAADKTP